MCTNQVTEHNILRHSKEPGLKLVHPLNIHYRHLHRRSVSQDFKTTSLSTCTSVDSDPIFGTLAQKAPTVAWVQFRARHHGRRPVAHHRDGAHPADVPADNRRLGSRTVPRNPPTTTAVPLTASASLCTRRSRCDKLLQSRLQVRGIAAIMSNTVITDHCVVTMRLRFEQFTLLLT